MDEHQTSVLMDAAAYLSPAKILAEVQDMCDRERQILQEKQERAETAKNLSTILYKNSAGILTNLAAASDYDTAMKTLGGGGISEKPS